MARLPFSQMPPYSVLENFLRAGRNPSQRSLSTNLTVKTTKDGLAIYSYNLPIYTVTPEEMVTVQGFESTPTTKRHLSSVLGPHGYFGEHGFMPFDGMQLSRDGSLLNPPWTFDKALVVEKLTAICQAHGAQRPRETYLKIQIQQDKFILSFLGNGYTSRCVSSRKAVSVPARAILKSQGWPAPEKQFVWNHHIRGLQAPTEHEIMHLLQVAS